MARSRARLSLSEAAASTIAALKAAKPLSIAASTIASRSAKCR